MTVEITKISNLKRTKIITIKQIINQILIKKREKFVFSTGTKSFDTVLGGGFHSKNLYIIFGANRTGKTQLCHQMCIQAYKFSSQSIYLDTENTFRPERIKELALSQSLDFKKTLKNILVSKIMSTSALLLTLKDIEATIKRSKIKIIIIDSINNHFRAEVGDKKFSYTKVKATFIKILEELSSLVENYNIIIIVTAQVSPNFIESAPIAEYPVGLQFLSHFFSEFLYLSYKEKESGYVHLINSNTLSEKKILYRITNKGIEDYKI